MPSDELVKAAYNNLPCVDMFMITWFRFIDAEFGNVKATSKILEKNHFSLIHMKDHNFFGEFRKNYYTASTSK